MILSILALVAMAGVAYMGAVQGVHRAAQTLVALVLAGVVAFGLFGPVTGQVFPASDDVRSTWYYVGDAFCLWALFCVLLLGLRLLGERLLRSPSDFPVLVDRIGGGVLGAGVGYLAVGVCLVIVQMLPVSPSLLGYEPFRYVPGTSEADPERVEPADRLWLDWDRGTLALFGYLSGVTLGSEENCLFERYGDVYKPAEGSGGPGPHGADAPAPADAVDFLYGHWYRRYEAIRWRTGATLGPIPEVPQGTAEGQGLALVRGRSLTLYGMSLTLMNATRSPTIEGFPDVRPPGGEAGEFLIVPLRFKPAARLPRTIDSSQFHLIDALGGAVGGAPMVYGEAKRVLPKKSAPQGAKEPPPEMVLGYSSAQTEPRNLRYGFSEGSSRGRYLMDGARFTFLEPRQSESRILIFAVPKTIRNGDMRLFMKPAVPAAPEAGPPVPQAGKAPAKPVAKPPAAPASAKPAAK